MPRKARKKSTSNIYHVILRGINRQIIFEDDGDRHYFMTVLKYCKEISDFRLYAFCLMDNHIHLLMEPAGEPLEQIFRRFGARYVIWYNRKYERAGHLFQNRFISENVDSSQYFMTVLRYILQNPMKAGMESRPGTYRWSSFLAYQNGSGSITDTEYAINMFGSRDLLIDFVLQGSEDTVMDEEIYDWRLRDEPAKEIMKQVTHCANPSEFQLLSPEQRKAYARELYQENLSKAQIARLTGMPRTSVRRAVDGFQTWPVAEEETVSLHEPAGWMFQPPADEIW